MNTPDDLEQLTGRLCTGRYQTWRPSQGVPIRSTVGEPKFWRHGPLVFVRQLAPWGLMDQLDPAEFDVAYRERLDRDGEVTVAKLAAVARQHPGRALLVLCFEDVWAGQSCHRRVFADWMGERFDIGVPEVVDGPAPGDVEQPRLPL